MEPWSLLQTPRDSMGLPASVATGISKPASFSFSPFPTIIVAG